ncbi:restriction endonuclease [Halorussus caseinilyticus]|uniref:Restriction endonuclease n=1 Tax=Halorussus caseinilyticus TaxID=3034025 RepID=A0ABD5WG23_9EURY
MTGIVILPAGRDDAFEDYRQFIRNGHPIDDIEYYLDEDDLELFRTTSDDDLVHVWGTSVDGTWQNVERNDIALVYHDGGFVARDKSSNCDMTPTSLSTSGRRASTTDGGMTRALGNT